ncbi:MAG TPA: cell division protein ZapE [Gammaproteobacteria bacterium]|nr:cell division protein ZapE [Gammaproteobacteria bacterium]
MTPLEYYQKKIAAGEILEDRQQLTAIEKFEAIYTALLTEPQGFISQFRKKSPPRGLYLWGSVGIGKTFLMDTFYYCLPFEDKLRIHFYAFMREVHHELRALQGTKNPLQMIAKNWARKTRIICFDELIITDIADALLLGGLLQALFQQGICLIVTANVSPDDLYKNGLQRELFLPAIAEIKARLDVVHLQIVDDYRANYRNQTKYYWYPLTTKTLENMEQCFVGFSHGIALDFAPLLINNRSIRIKKQAGSVVWFDFMDICGIPRSHEDYLAITKKFDTILVSNLTKIGENDNDLARSFIRFIDVLYDAKTRLVIAAAQPIAEIYTSGQLLFEFARTCSRLTQMQSGEWE